MLTKNIFRSMSRFGIGLFVLTVAFSCAPTQVQWKNASIEDELSSSNDLREKYWKLVSINDVPFENQEEREVYMILKKDQKNVIGFSGCNPINGSYQLTTGNRVKVSTRSNQTTCVNELKEKQVLDVLNSVQGFKVDKDTLYLYQGEGKTSKWEAVYLK